jgi:hypothetical protein
LDENKRFLLLQEKDGSWSLPWWGLSHGDNIQQSLMIKVAKELGVQPDWFDSNPCYFVTAIDDNDQEEWKWNIVYEVSISDRNFVLWKDEIDYRFFSKQEALREHLTKNTIEFVNVFNPDKH